MPDTLSLILDDNAGDFTYSVGPWTLSTEAQWYNMSSWWAEFGSGKTLGSFSLIFEGISVAFIGNTAPGGHSQSASVAIDGGKSVTIAYGGLPHTYKQWYKSPTLSEGRHTIRVGNLDQTAVDFAIVTAGPNTPLSGKMVMVDDGDSAIVYSSGWMHSSNGFISGTLPSGLPYGQGTHRTSTVGDSLSFRFTGTSTSIYGIFDWAKAGILSATYTLDGNHSSHWQTYPVTTSTIEFVNQVGEAQNFLFFHSGDLPAGDHTLTVSITQCTNQEFVLDYITYTPSFSTPASMPLLRPIYSAVTPSSIGSPLASPPVSSGSLGSSANESNLSSHSRDKLIGPILGGVGGCLLLICLLLLLYFLKRRRTEKHLSAETVATSNRTNLDVQREDQLPQSISNAGISHLPKLPSHAFPTDSKRALVASKLLNASRARTSSSTPHSRSKLSPPKSTTTITEGSSDSFYASS